MCPKVSICMVTYNHEKYIGQAIESVLMQSVNFDYEIVIGEDCSTDNTRDILIGYQKRYPDKINLLLNESNVGAQNNFIGILNNCKGKYVACLEGDDYWTEPSKLQKQTNFLDSHPDFVICFHWAGWLDQETEELKSWKYGPPVIKPYYTVDDLLEYSNFIPTCSVMFRNGLLDGFPDWFFKAGIGDFPLHIMNAQHGKIGFLDEPMAVYRRHKEGRHGGQTPSQNLVRLLDLYTLIGLHMHLDKQTSYHIGVSKLNIELSRAYVSDGKFIKALSVVYDAFKTAPSHQKVATFSRLIVTLIPHYLRGLIYESISILKHKGLKVFVGMFLKKAKLK
jgi:glycosyltransferase involved in cell wall biosynthesis